MKSVKIREIAEALRCVKLELTLGPGFDAWVHLMPGQAELLAELAIRAMTTPTEEMLRVGADGRVGKARAGEVWQAMCREALR